MKDLNLSLSKSLEIQISGRVMTILEDRRESRKAKRGHGQSSSTLTIYRSYFKFGEKVNPPRTPLSSHDRGEKDEESEKLGEDE